MHTIPLLVAGTYRVKAFANNHNHKLTACNYLAFENTCNPSRNVYQPDMGHSSLTTRHRNGQSAIEVNMI
eukprot:713895-Pelagomonas_calceolata.AAC.1